MSLRAGRARRHDLLDAGRDARSCSPLRAVADTKTRYRPRLGTQR